MVQKNKRFSRRVWEIFQIYFHDFNVEQPLISKEEKRELLILAQGGDKEARDQLILAHLRLVFYVVNYYYGEYDCDLEDLVQEGYMGLIKAISKFDINREFQFSTYAFCVIRRTIQSWLLRQNQSMSFSSNALEKMQSLRLSYDRLMMLLEREPSKEELAADIGVSVERLQQFYSYAFMPTQSLDYVAEEFAFSDPLVESLVDPESVGKEYENSEYDDLHQYLESIYETMPERWGKVLREHYPMDGSLPKTLKAIGKETGITRERTRQIKEKGLKKLRGMESLHEYFHY